MLVCTLSVIVLTSEFDLVNCRLVAKTEERVKSVSNLLESRTSCHRYIRVLQEVHRLLTTEENVTKRSLYYSDVNLFGSQQVSDKCLDNVGKL